MVNNVLEIKGLSKIFNKNKSTEVKAVNDVSFTIKKGETFGLVGESGCGKSTLGRTIINLYSPTDGEIIIDGQNILELSKSKRKTFLNNKVQMIFQDPYASLNPRFKVMDIISEGIKVQKKLKSKEEIRNKVYELLELVGLSAENANRFPHEFSGGQRQRIGIARALAVEPEIIIADEPISALDVSIQAQIVNLLLEIQRKKGLTILFIAHDLAMVRYISDTIGVMYKGKIVEIGEADNIYKKPLHPYTQSLLSAIPIAHPQIERNRKRFSYDANIDGFKNEENLSLNYISLNHSVLCTEEKARNLQQKFS
ncbi:ABC transporter ATP-binding protein [Staphylococcus massiliensis]|uniref:Oligopeptide ABC transporter ATP-binding protein OppF n=1 Tax=Staphylococcus massiliensis S46 TaxID=1229783 RepID=K9AL46_9STAP|nr:ATP-binding cassette domain-containing protein [Staphylococcus massiliensis]EKU48088.1 oligopeptide ABC transporter ATP-binding protein OppF [Staphylococcus massiliensis S46]MCG3399976.1 ATP-binding cassette domain-containing protein [Staphylococcus massiliensis]MCG3401602.1 ATP-binding cassette domain-containing protein [Staphylococcus massiliensis]MCG3412137.1 ATP-binding cassette domain-containing protein [Staphylococcus massiliensis]POA01229.1 ABC transporter ATP-binding protein [Staphy